MRDIALDEQRARDRDRDRVAPTRDAKGHLARSCKGATRHSRLKLSIRNPLALIRTLFLCRVVVSKEQEQRTDRLAK